MGSLDNFFSNTEDSVRKLKDEILEDYLNIITGLANEENMDDGITIKDCESPVERMFYLAIHHKVEELGIREEVYIEPQKVITVGLKSYRVDFYISLMNPKNETAVSVFVEIDGHAFHEKTKEQVARDKKRERALATEADSLLRFSGSEIYRDAQERAWEVIDVLFDKERSAAKK